MSTHPSILIVDYGSQYTQVIARTLRELHLRSAVLTPKKAEQWLLAEKPKAVILSGGDARVTDIHAPQLPDGLLDMGIPILGICYGMQLLVHALGGKVESNQLHAEYGKAEMYLEKSPLFKGIEGMQTVWASHGDTVSSLPAHFKAIAHSKRYPYAAIAHEQKHMWAVQFHPEVIDTPCGKDILSNFLYSICSCEKDWYPTDIIQEIHSTLGKQSEDKRIIVGFSGGVDSTVLSSILAPVFKENLLGICINGGHLRENEIEEIKKHAAAAKITLKIINAEHKFLSALKGIKDAEAKRDAFRSVYRTIFETEIKEWNADYIGQGTLITDLIESGKKGGALIKTHHNTDLQFKVKELSPLDHLFKYEVRALASELQLPESVINRQPFPGPGLFVRIFGGEVTKKRLEIAREADAIARKIISNDRELSQLVVGLDCSKTVGVKGDDREYGYNIVVRGVQTIDFMTAYGVQFPDILRRELTATITQIPGVTRVFFDETNKPPATTEFE